MSNTLQNIIIAAIAVVLIVLGYVVFISPQNQVLNEENSDILSDQLLARAQQFIAHRAILDDVTIDAGVFSDSRFTTLRIYTETLDSQSLGNSNPFMASSPADETTEGE